MTLSESKKDALMLVGRVLLSAIFIISGWGKITGFAGTVAFTATVLPFPELMVIAAIIFEFIGGLALLVGFKTELAAWGLVVFTLVAGFAFHFNFADQVQSVMFLKNISMVGGLLYVVVAGAGRYSIDAKMAKGTTV